MTCESDFSEIGLSNFVTTDEDHCHSWTEFSLTRFTRIVERIFLTLILICVDLFIYLFLDKRRILLKNTEKKMTERMKDKESSL